MEQQFLVMVNSTGTAPALTGRLSASLPDATPVRPRSFNWRGNWVQVWENDDYDPGHIDSPEDGYLFYRFRIEVSPTEEVTDDHQIRAARELVAALESLHLKAVVCADFEDEV